MAASFTETVSGALIVIANYRWATTLSVNGREERWESSSVCHTIDSCFYHTLK